MHRQSKMHGKIPSTKVTVETVTIPGHSCEIVTDSQSCLPKLPPQASSNKKFVRWMRKKLMVSRGNPRTRMFMKSQAATKAEKRRQLQCSWFIIHPFSQFSIYREIIMCFVWIVVFTVEPLIIAFFPQLESDANQLSYLLVFTDVCTTLNMVICFVTGYHVTKTKEIVLSRRKIAKHYLHTYFTIDLAMSLPSSTVMSGIFHVHDSKILITTAIFQAIGFCRLGTMLVYFRQITLQLGMTDMLHEFLCVLLMTALILHWFACAVYLIPSIMYYNTGDVKNTSWTFQANMSPNHTQYHMWHLYSESYLMSLSHFLTSGHGYYVTTAIEEEALFCLIYLTGLFYIGYIIAVVFEMIGSTRAAESKYEEIIHQLDEYMRDKQLPHDLRKRLLLYYKSRFHMRYFRETVILSALSEQQRTELFLFSCKELIENAKIFQSIPKSFMGTLMSSLKNEVYLTNDVIIKAGAKAEYMFFIDKGTVAEVLSTGKEIRHLEDGEHFGEMHLVLKEASGKKLVNYVAVEVTECYRLEKKDLFYCMSQHEEFASRLKKEAREKYDVIMQMEDDEDFIINRKDVLYDLRSGKILEHPRHRMPIEKK